jgi:hypothetical protein
VTTVDEEVREGSFPEDEHDPDSTAEARAGARESVTPPSSISRQLVTDCAQAVRRVLASARGFAARPDSLADSQPHSYRQARAFHHRCASHFEAALLRWPRLAWGYLHMAAVKWPLNLLEWLTESPARCVIAVAVWFIARHWG